MKNGIIFPQMLPERQWWQNEEYTNRIKKIVFIDTVIDIDNGDIELSWDISNQSDGTITAMLKSNMSEVIIAGNGSGKVLAPKSMKGMFEGFSAVESIEGIGDILDTSNVENMEFVFRGCLSLKELDVSKWDVSQVTSFRGTFSCGHNQLGDAKITTLNIAGWDVSNAKDMAYMFYGCGKLEHIDLKDWNVSNVTNFRHTFADCFSLKELNVENWDTSSVVTLDGIFNDCRSVTSIDVSNWDTSSCEEFDQFFDGCCSLKEIKGLNGLDTSNGISFEEMFFGCRNIKELDLSSIDTRKVDGHEFVAYELSLKCYSNMKNFLVGCNNLKKLKTGPNLVFYSTRVVDDDENTILKALNDTGYVIVSPVTGSMYPMVRPKLDHVVFRKEKEYKKNDIVLYRSEKFKELVMHRIIRKLNGGYLICGDNAYNSEYILEEDVFARVAELYRGNWDIKRNSLKYQIFSFYSINRRGLSQKYHMCRSLFLRGTKKARRIASRLKRRIKKMQL